MSRLGGGFVEQQRQKFYSHIRPEIRDLVDVLRESRGQLSIGEFRSLAPLNTYEAHLLHPFLDDSALLDVIGSKLQHVSVPMVAAETLNIPVVYDEILIGWFLPLLIQRLRARLDGGNNGT